jgi:hypothetical protein
MTREEEERLAVVERDTTLHCDVESVKKGAFPANRSSCHFAGNLLNGHCSLALLDVATWIAKRSGAQSGRI